jgi:hypothetical protein
LFWGWRPNFGQHLIGWRAAKQPSEVNNSTTPMLGSGESAPNQSKREYKDQANKFVHDNQEDSRVADLYRFAWML